MHRLDHFVIYSIERIIIIILFAIIIMNIVIGNRC